MTVVAGADGCRSGWICIRKDLDTCTISDDAYETADALIHHQPAPAVLAIDIPIGLCSDGARHCDRLARQHLGRLRSSSVFPAPLRPLLKARTWEEAAHICKQLSGKSISKQVWGIFSKVREVDRLLGSEPGLQDRIAEVHPEVCFWAWNGETAMPFSKKSPEGRDSRQALVDDHFGESAFVAVRRKYRMKDVATDDILDAFAALWTAERIIRGQARTLPATEVRDPIGLRMRIMY